MSNTLTRYFCRTPIANLLLLAGLISQPQVQANPTGGTVTQGTATISTSGSQLTVHQTSANAFINWQSFNIGAGQTTTFIQPSASSIAWNQINGASPSQILGNLNANGYVVLENANGFYIGGQAAITAHGLVMTTATTPALNLSSGGPWSFDAPPPTAKIINFGQIHITGGGSAFLIASDIENNGTISDPAGKIGLYAGEQVLVSMSPDGRGLSAQVTLPAGSVDNEGNLIADAGSIAAQAQVVNQNGLIQANSVRNNNGVIELVASDTVNLGANSTISAQGGSAGVSSGGSVTIKSDHIFSDQAGSTINISGGAQGGNGGQVEISAPQMASIQSQIAGQAAAGFAGGVLTVDPENLWLAGAASDPAAPPGYTVINVNSYSGLSQINLQADNNLTLNTLWTLTDLSAPGTLSLTAGNDLTLNNNAGIKAGQNWSINMVAGTALGSGSLPVSGNDGVYFDGTAYMQTKNGNINLWAANEVQITTGGISDLIGISGIRTLNGGNISVTAQYGDVNTGSNPNGFNYVSSAPYATVSSSVGGISTAAGGNVTITAGGNVISYLPSGSTSVTAEDGGTGAFGPEAGNVTITAGGNVFGHYVLANGIGTITAGQNVGTPSGANAFALSLIDGTWNVNAPEGNIYLQEVRNPNGVFNNSTAGRRGPASAGAFLFTYGPQATVDLNAGMGVYLTDLNVPRLSADPVPIIYPPIVDITAGPGGVNLEGNVTLFPSVHQNLDITTTGGGSLVSVPNGSGIAPELLMSDSSHQQWVAGKDYFTDTDLGTAGAVEPTDPNPAVVNISGNMENLTLITTKATEITVGGDMIGCGFSGQNLRPSDVTSITVGGQIYNRSPYSFVYGINIPSVPAADLPPGIGSTWDAIFTLAVNPALIANLQVPPASTTPASQLAAYALQSASLFGETVVNGQLVGINPGFVYNPAMGRLGYSGQMSSTVLSALTPQSGTFTVLQLNNGVPVTYTGADGRLHFQTTTVSWVAPSEIAALYLTALGAPSATDLGLGYRIGGPGQFDINAGSIELGNTYGILSCGAIDPSGGYYRYGNLASITPSGASVNVTVSGDLSMLTSTIATLAGGDVNVISTGGSMDLGSPDLGGAPFGRDVGYGVFTTSGGNVNVTALKDINIDGSRIGTFDGGNILVESLQGNVNVGSGASGSTKSLVNYVNPVTGSPEQFVELVYGSGILAFTLVPAYVDNPWPPGVASVPGNITVETPRGNISSSVAGVLQESLSGSVAAGPTITLAAGTPASGTQGQPGYSAGYPGNIDLGASGVIGDTVNLTANGNITGLIISSQSSTVNAAQSFTGTLLAGGTASLTAGGTVSGTVIGVSGANVTGGGAITASVLGQNVSVGGKTSDTLGSSATATGTSQAAAEQANTQAQQQVASEDTAKDDEKKKQKKPVIQRTGRVTVLLSTAVPP
jgi:filamentous hemagglutinin family protein